MIRLFFVLNLLLLNLYACKGGYTSCIKKINDATTIQKNSLSIPIRKDVRLVYSKCKPNAKILKHDPFLSLYLIEDKSGFPYNFEINMRQQLGVAVVSKTQAKEGKITRKQVGLNSLAAFSETVSVPALLTSSCCSLEGIVTPDGIIQRDYIKRFISSSSADYSDIGIRVHDEKGYVIVIASNPYIQDNPLKKGDCVIGFDGLKIKDSSTFMKRVLFSKIGSTHTIKIKRNKKILKFTVTSKKRDGGGEISDTFLEFSGIFFNKKLEVVKLSPAFKEYGLVLGDRLIQVHGVKIKTQEELRKYIEDYKDFSTLLFERKNFEFFVNIK